jgi:hypothetical protein
VIGEGGDHVIVGESLLGGGPPLPEPPRFPLEATPEQELRVAAMSETANVSRASGHESLVRMAISLGKQKFNVAWMFHREEWLPWLNYRVQVGIRAGPEIVGTSSEEHP